MSDVQANEETVTEEGSEAEESEGIRNLRETNKRLSEEAAEGKDAKRELAFLRAGVDPEESPAAKFFAQHYDGELNADAIKKAYGDLGLAQGEPVPDPEPEPEVDPEVAKDQATAAKVNSTFGSEPTQPVSELEGPHPMRQIRENVDQKLQEGLSREDVYPMAVGQLWDAFSKGDPRVMTSREKTNAEVQALRDQGIDVR